MGRGESNILYDPFKIQKKKGRISVLSSKRSPDPLHNLYLGEDDFFLTRNDKQELSLFKGDVSEEIVLPEISSDTPIALNSQGVFWYQEGVLYLQTDQELDRYPIEDVGDVVDLYATENSLNYIAVDAEQKFTLYRTPRGLRLQGDTKTKGRPLLKSSYITFDKKGDSALLLFTRSKNLVPGEIDAFFLIGDEIKDTHHLEKDISLDLRALDIYGERYLVPAEDDGAYFYLTGRELRYLDLQTGTEKVVASIDRSTVSSMASSAGKVVLLARDRLLLFNKKGLLDEVGLSRGYDKVSLHHNRALLWSIGEQDCLEISFS